MTIFLSGCLSFYSQVGTVRFHLKVRGVYKWITDKNVVVSVNDSLEKALISDKKGYTGFLELPQGKHRLTFTVEGYNTLNRTVRVIKASGKTMRLRMKKT